MPLRQTQERELTDEEALAFLTGAGAQQGAERELSDEEAMAYLTGAPGASGGKEKPGPLQTIGGTLLDVGANIAQFPGLVRDYLSTTQPVASGGMRPIPGSNPAAPPTINAPKPLDPNAGNNFVSTGLREAAEEVYPPEIRGTGSFWGETIPGALTRTGATVATGLFLGPAAAVMQGVADRGASGFNEALEETGGDREKAMKALVVQGGLGAADALLGAGSTYRDMGKRLAEKGLIEVGKTIAKTVATEVPQELTDQAISDGFMEVLTGKDRDNWKNLVDTLGPATTVALFFGGAKGLSQMGGGSETRSQAVPERSEGIQMPADRQPVQATLQGLKPDPGVPATPPASGAMGGPPPGATGQPAAAPVGQAVDVEEEVRQGQTGLAGIAREIPRAAAGVVSPELVAEADTSPVSGLLNQRAGKRESTRLLTERRPGTRLIRLRFDGRNAKAANLFIGHAENDKVLKAMGGSIVANMRPGDVPEHVSGDEFGATIQVTEDADVNAIVKRIEDMANAAAADLGLDELQGYRFGLDGAWAEVEGNTPEALAAADLKADRAVDEKKKEGGLSKRDFEKLSPEEQRQLVERAVAERAEKMANRRGQPTAPLQPEEMTAEQLDPDKAPNAPQVGPVEEPGSTTGIKNATVERELKEMGLPPPTKGTVKSDVDVHARAKERFAQDDRPAEKLLDELESKPRAVSDEDAALLTFEANRLKQARRKAQDAFNEDPSEENGKAVAKAQAAYSRAADIFDAIGTESGRSLRARRMMLNEDYSLAQMERELQVAKGGEALTSKERAELTKVQKDLEAATKRADEADLKVAQLEAERSLAKLKKQAAKLPVEKPPRQRRSAIEKTKKEIEEIYLRMGERAKGRVHSGSGFGPDDVPDLVLLAGKHIKLGVQTFEAWAAEVVARLGEGIRPHLRVAWNEAEKKRGESRLKAQRTRLTNEISDLERRIAEKDFTEKERRPRTPDAGAVKLSAEREALKRRFEKMKAEAERANRTITEKAVDFAKEILDIPRAIFSSYDFSAVRRQGGFWTSSAPWRAKKHIKEMFGAWASPRAALEAEVAIKKSRNYELAKSAGLEFTSADGIGPREEVFRSRMAEKIPGLPASNRAYVTYLNAQRMAAFDALIESMPHKVGLEEAKRIADFVNITTGRASGKGASLARKLEAIKYFHAPSYVVSRFQVLGRPLSMLVDRKLSFAAKRAIGKQYLKYAAGQAVYYGLLAMMAEGLEDLTDERFSVETDIRSTDFGKVRIGNVRLDPFGGLQQTAVLLSRLITGEAKSLKGKKQDLANPKGVLDPTYASVLLRFLRSKAGPIPQRIWDAAEGKTYVGEKVTRTEALTKLPVPGALEDIYETFKALGAPSAAILGFFALFGDSLNAHTER